MCVQLRITRNKLYDISNYDLVMNNFKIFKFKIEIIYNRDTKRQVNLLALWNSHSIADEVCP